MTTAATIIQRALQSAGIIERTGTPSSDQNALGLERLNDLINLWVTQGIKLWLLEEITLVLVLDQVEYTLSGRPLRVEGARYVDSSGNRRTLTPLSRQEFLDLSNITTSGSVTSYYIDRQATTTTISLWHAPDASAVTGTVQVDTRKQVANFTGTSDTMAFPQEWALALIWGLADELCTGQPTSITERCERRASAYRQALEDFEVEEAETRLLIDNRAYRTGNFV